jgi:iron complex outermembrane recepter protein
MSVSKTIFIAFFCFFLANNTLFPQKNLSDSLVLKTVVIQSNRADDNAAVPHNNFNATKIAQNNQGQDVPYLLRSVPSLIESSDAGTGIGYTGVRIRGSDPTRVNVTINGIPLNDAESQGVYWVNLPDLAASASEIQVQRGVGNSTNGTGAFGANINVDISKVQAEAGANLINTLGSFGTRKHTFQANTGLLSNHWAFTGRLSKINSNGYIDRAKVNLDASHVSGAYIDDNQTFMLHVLSGKEITYQAWNGVPAQYIDIPALRTFNSAGTEKPDEAYKNEVDDYTQKHILGHYKRKINDHTELQINANFTRGYGFFEQYKADQSYIEYGLKEPGDTSYPTTDLIRQRWLNNKFATVSAFLKIKPANAKILPITFGAYHSRYKGRHYGEIIWMEVPSGTPLNYLYYNGLAQKNDWNVFGNSGYVIGKKWTSLLDLQVRYLSYVYQETRNNRNTESKEFTALFFNPKVSLIYNMSAKKSFYFYVGMANREPNRDDIVPASASNLPKSESLIDLEIGHKIKTVKSIFNINFFGMWYKNQLVLNGKINDVGAYTRINVPKSFRTGLEFEAATQITERLQLNGNFSLSSNKILEFVNYTDNWDLNGQNSSIQKFKDLAYSPRISAYWEVNYLILNHKKQQLFASIVSKFVGAQYLDNTQNFDLSLPQYGTQDFKIRYHMKDFFSKDINLILSVNNVFNKKYSSNAWTYRYISDNYDARQDNVYTRKGSDGSYNQTGFFPQAGIHWLLTLDFNF